MSADPRLVKRCLVAVILVLACDAKQAEPPGGGEAKPETSKTEPKSVEVGANTCMPDGLEAATRLEVIAVPSGCEWAERGSLAVPLRLTTSEQLDAALRCDETAARPSLDFAAEELEVAEFNMSPAFAGLEVVDDGAMVTFVERQRSPCPDDPMPMPMSSTIAYRIAKGAARQHRTLSCTLPPRCR